MSETIIDFIRHGEPEGGRRYRGWTDDPLSERGWAQMWAAVEVAAPWEQIISSPLSRCKTFAQALAERLALPYQEDRRLMEVGYGGWEGRSGADLKRDDPDVLARFYHDPVHSRPADAEPLDSFSRRVGEAFDDILRRYLGHHVLVITHAGVIRAVIARVMDAPLSSLYRISVPNASLARVRSNAERPPTLVFHARPCL